MSQKLIKPGRRLRSRRFKQEPDSLVTGANVLHDKQQNNSRLGAYYSSGPAMHIEGGLQRKTADGVNPEEEKLPVQTKSGKSAATTIPLSKSINSTTAGSPVHSQVRNKVEPVLGHDLGGTQVHNDAQANKAAESINARAFTHGNHVYLGEGESPHDVKLMAHELTHVAQQTKGTASPHGYQKSDAGSKQTSARSENSGQAKESALVSPVFQPSIQRQSLGGIISKGLEVSKRVFDRILKKKEEKEEKLPHLRAAMAGKVSTPLPVFQGKQADAYKDIVIQLKSNPRDPEQPLGDLIDIKYKLDKIVKPKGKESIYDAVIMQLHEEIKLKINANQFYNRMGDFTHALHEQFILRLQIVDKYLELKNSDVANILINRIISEGFESIGEIPGAKSKVIAEVLKIGWDVYKKASEASSQNKVSKAIIQSLDELGDAFANDVQNIFQLRLTTLTDWAALKEVGELKFPLKAIVKTRAGARMLKAARKAYEIQLWKDLLPTKWAVYSSSDSPRFYNSIVWTERNQSKHPNMWHDIEPVDEEHWYGDKHGWDVTEYWLGDGSKFLTHTKPDNDLVKRIYSLGVSRKELLMDWPIPSKTFEMPTPEKRFGKL